MKKITFLFILAALANQIQAGQIIGQLTDPVDMNIDAYTDIISARVEKNGEQLTFVIETRGNIPDASVLPEFDDTITYLWLVNADMNPRTGQSTWNNVSSEFNVRGVISRDPNRAGGFVDVTGAMEGGGGGGTVVVQANRIQITIDRGQIASVKRFLWKSDAFKDFHGYGESNNQPTPMSGFARACRYGVLFDANDLVQSVEDRLLAFIGGDPCTAVIDLINQNGGDFPVFLSMERKYPDQNNYQIFAQAMGHSGINHLRTFSRLDVENAAPNAFGESQTSASCDNNFVLDGEPGQTGMIPQGVFFLKFIHNYRLFALDMQGQASARSFAQIVLNRYEPLEMIDVWVHQKQVWNEDVSTNYEQQIDLADYGLEFGVTYRISSLLVDVSAVPTETTYAEAVTDATLNASIDVIGPEGDIDGDWDIDFADLAIMANNWFVNW